MPIDNRKYEEFKEMNKGNTNQSYQGIAATSNDFKEASKIIQTFKKKVKRDTLQ